MRRALILVAGVLSAALVVVPGFALASASGGHSAAKVHSNGNNGNGNGNGTPNPPPSNPPCNADGHNGSPPPYGGPNQNSGTCSHSASSSAHQDCDGDNDHSNCGNGGQDCDGDGDSSGCHGHPDCDNDHDNSNCGSGGQDCDGDNDSSGCSSNTSTTATTTSTSNTNTGGETSVCETGGLLPTGQGDGPTAGGNETLGDAVYDGISGSPLGDLSGLIQDPGERGFGPLSGGLNGVPAPVGTELACLVNVVYLQGGSGSLPHGL